jgi:hypothetical protein
VPLHAPLNNAPLKTLRPTNGTTGDFGPFGSPEASQDPNKNPCDLQGFYANGARGTRTPDLLGAIQALSQLSYSPTLIPTREPRRGCCKCSDRAMRRRVVGATAAARRRRSPRKVWFAGAMGLLDDAIREHLEFKRQHGADPDEVARQENEALGPVDRGENVATAMPASPAQVADESGEGSAQTAEDQVPASDQESSNVGEETAELDMRTVLKTEPPVRAATTSTEESLEWDMPGEAAAAGAESPVGVGGEGAEGPVEDVLEETPDFLRDTPDQDCLWFEQQPPRDFDFDK